MQMATGNASAAPSNSSLLAIEKRLNAVEFDFKRMSDPGKSVTLLTGELERINAEQTRYKKHLKALETTMKQYTDMTETMSMASSKKSAKSKTERKLEKEIEKIKEE